MRRHLSVDAPDRRGDWRIDDVYVDPRKGR
jgi:hypothetical protein